MNIISNDCTAGFIYKEINLRYGNPFIWTSIDSDNFIKLIENYDSIDFSNISVNLIKNTSKISVQNELCPVITIDNQVNVYYFHHFYKQGIKESIDTEKRYIYDEDISSYVINSYNRRIQNMKEQPIFIWSDFDNYTWYKSDLDRFNNISSKYKIIIYTNKNVTFNNHNITVVHKKYHENLVEKNAINISHKFNRTLVYTCCDEKYSHFIPLFCAALLYSNDNIDIEIGVSNSKLTDEEEQALNYLRNKFSNSQILIRYNMFEVDYNKPNIYQAKFNNKEMMINSIRFISEPIIKDTYTYISDIDIISFEKNFYNIHINEMSKNNLVYDNIVRKNTDRLSGLHFVLSKYQYPLNIKDIKTDINDEQLLLNICKDKYIINKELTFRPVHGIHMSLNRNITITENIPGWGADKWKNNWLEFIQTDIYKNIEQSFDPLIKELISKLNNYYNNV